MRNHRSQSHLAVVNNQKAEALKTFKTFIESAESSEIRDAVLLETTRSIFSPTVTGFLGPNEELPSSPIFDLARQLNKTGQ